jgi:hypothetical protein
MRAGLTASFFQESKLRSEVHRLGVHGSAGSALQQPLVSLTKEDFPNDYVGVSRYGRSVLAVLV